MKTIKSNIFVCLCAVLGMNACTVEDLPTNEPVQAQKLTLEVNENSYVSEVPLQGRAITHDLQTSFKPGDIIGVYTVVDGKVKQSNVGMLYSPDANMWIGELKKEESSDAKYFVYYPWQMQVQDEVKPDATTAEEFFSDVINSWKVPTNQSTYGAYMSANLMIGDGTVSDGSKLTATLDHKMSLVVVNLPKTKYELTTTDGTSLQDYIVPPADLTFSGYQPCFQKDGSYRFLVKPQSSVDFGGSFQGNEGKRNFSVTVSNLNKGCYQVYNIDKATETVKKHTLKAGDYYTKDGHLIAADENLTDEQKANCLGVVYWTGNPTQSDIILNYDHPNCVHGLVCSLKDGNIVKWQEDVKYYNQTVQHWVSENTYGYRNLITGGDPDENMNEILGYNNTKVMTLYNDATENSLHKLGVADDLVGYQVYAPAPIFTSNWYIPSIKEAFIMMNSEKKDIYQINFPDGTNYKLLNAQFAKLGEPYAEVFNTRQGGSGDYYYTSSEHNVYKVWTIGSSTSGPWYLTVVSENDKDYSYRIRYVLAF